MGEEDVTVATTTTPQAVAEHRSANLPPGGEAVLTFEPERPMRGATLFASCDPPDARAIVRRVLHGEIPVVAYCTTVEALRTGLLVGGDVTAAEPLRVVVGSEDSRPVAVSASLVSGEETKG